MIVPRAASTPMARSSAYVCRPDAGINRTSRPQSREAISEVAATGERYDDDGQERSLGRVHGLSVCRSVARVRSPERLPKYDREGQGIAGDERREPDHREEDED